MGNSKYLYLNGSKILRSDFKKQQILDARNAEVKKNSSPKEFDSKGLDASGEPKVLKQEEPKVLKARILKHGEKFDASGGIVEDSNVLDAKESAELKELMEEKSSELKERTANIEAEILDDTAPLLDEMTNTELKQYIKEELTESIPVKGLSTMKKSDLIAYILEQTSKTKEESEPLEL